MERYVIHVTKRCNMACTYCYEKDKTSTYTWEEIRTLVDKIVKYNKEFMIEFLGGEPLLAFDLIKKAYEYLESIKGVKVEEYAITTNGTILNEEIIRFIKDNPKIVWAASLDGTLQMNQLRVMKDTGKNSYPVVMENIKTLLREIGSRQISIHMVTHPYNVYHLAKSVDHLYKQGIRSIGVGTVESTIPIGREYCERFVQQMDAVSQAIHDGKYPGLNLDTLESLKPRSDVRHYIYDDNGKLIAESYGRAGDDITKDKGVHAKAVSSPISVMIEDIREFAYINHQRRMGRL